MITIGVDPAFSARNRIGIARFDGGALDLAWAAKTPLEARKILSWNHCDRLVVEFPCFRGRNSKGDPNQLLDLARAAALMIPDRHVSVAEWVLPHEWKGSVPKDIFTARIEQRLSERELSRFDKMGFNKTERHNVLDAIGLCLWAKGRL